MPVPQVIDLSHHNTVLSLHDAAASGIVGVIHKATEGTTYVDPKCAVRRSLAADAGLLWGIYHFLRPGKIKKQAEWFLLQTQLFDNKTLLALDFEVGDITADDLIEWLKFVELNTGQKPVLYSGSYLKALKDSERLSGYRLWLAQYGKRAVLPKGFNDYFLWQYSDKGEVPGIQGNCDVNASTLTNAELRENWISPAANTQTPAPNPVLQPTNEPPIEPTAPAPVEVKREDASLWVKIGAGVTFLTGTGLQIGALVQEKLSAMTLTQVLYLLGCIGLIVLAVWWYRKEAKGAQNRTLALIDTAADPCKNTVELKK